jgi:hypothetical protein
VPPNHIEKNARAIDRYLQYVWPHYERSGNITDLPPMNQKHRREGDAPAGPHALALMHNNRGTSLILNPRLNELKGNREKFKNVQYRDVLAWVVYDAGLVGKWKAARDAEGTPESPEEAEQRAIYALYAEVYEKMCIHLAYVVAARYGDMLLTVRTDPDDEQLQTFEQGRARDAGKVHTHNAQTRYRNLYHETEEVMEEHNCTFEESWEIVNDRRKARKAEPVSPSTFERARRYMKGQIEEGQGFSRVIGEEAS